MLDDRASRIALAASLLLHAALFAPVRRFLPIPASSPPAAETAPEEPMVFRFVDRQPEPAEEPDEPSDLLAATDARAAQPEAPSELPRGAAFSPGRSPIPTASRPAGSPESGRAGEETPERAAPPAERRSETRPAPDRDSGPPASPGATDPRLAAALATPRLRPGRPEPRGAATAVPEVDQRLTRATSGSEFSLNTTAWRWGPYMERLKARIERHIAPPAAFYYGTAAWITRVRFRIAPDGRLTDVRLLDHRGVEDLQYVATDAIEDAADYEPLPPNFPEPYLEVTAGFYFNVLKEP